MTRGRDRAKERLAETKMKQTVLYANTPVKDDISRQVARRQAIDIVKYEDRQKKHLSRLGKLKIKI